MYSYLKKNLKGNVLKIKCPSFKVEIISVKSPISISCFGDFVVQVNNIPISLSISVYVLKDKRSHLNKFIENFC